MKVYVAGSVRDVERVKKVIAAIEDAGHLITFNWTGDEGEIREDANGKKWSDDPERARELAERELQAVWEADVAVLCGHEKILGAAIETGMALSDEKAVLILPGCPRESIFWYLKGVKLVETVDDVLAELDALDQEESDLWDHV